MDLGWHLTNVTYACQTQRRQQPPEPPRFHPAPYTARTGSIFFRGYGSRGVYIYIVRLTSWRYEREQHFPEYRQAVHQIVEGRRCSCLAGAFAIVVVAAAHRQRLRELFPPRARP